MKTIQLTQGQAAIVDDEFYESVCRHKWCVAKRGTMTYAVSRIKSDDGSSRVVYMHRFVMQLYGELHGRIDHRDRNGLNNQRSNMRSATAVQNGQNRGAAKRSKHGLKGIHYRPDCNKWRALIKADGRPIHLGYFATRELAAAAYDAAATKYFGEFANLNCNWETFRKPARTI
jgi:hypothetical protein